MAKDKIKEAKAANTWELYKQLPLMVDCGLITREQAEELKSQLNSLFHDALDIVDQ